MKKKSVNLIISLVILLSLFSYVNSRAIGGISIEETGDDGLGTDSNNSVIIAAPKVPQLAKTSSLTTDTANKIPVIYPGSNPSFEVMLKSNNSTISSISIKYSNNVSFNDISFKVIPVDASGERSILTLDIPDSVQTGEATLEIELSDNTSLSAKIKINDFLNFLNFGSTTSATNIPIIEKSDFSGSILTLSGKNFAGRKLTVFKDLNSVLLSSRKGFYTTISVFPTTLGIKAEVISVSKNGTKAKIQLDIPQDLPISTNDIVLTIATPRGITSKELLLRKD